MSPATPRKFVVICDNVKDPVVTKMAEHFKSINAGWSRYFSGGWLVATHDPNLTADKLVTKFIELAPGVDCIAFEVRGVPDWSFIVQDQEFTSNLKTWLEKQWK